MDAAAELGRNPVSKHQIQPEYGDKQADAGQDCRIRLTRPNSQARTRTGKYSFFFVQLTRVDNLTRLTHALAICVIIHTYNTSWDGQEINIFSFDHISRTTTSYTTFQVLLQSSNHSTGARRYSCVIGRVSYKWPTL